MPMTNFGSYGRTYNSMSVGSSRSKLGSAKRIQHHAKSHGYGTTNINPCQGFTAQTLSVRCSWYNAGLNMCNNSLIKNCSTCYSQANGNYDSFTSCICQANPTLSGCPSTN